MGRAPNAVWRGLREYGIDTLWDASQELMSEEAPALLEDAYRDEGRCAFNEGIMPCLPKKLSGITGDGIEYHTPEDTRPLTIVDTSNRLLANAVRNCVEEPLAAAISSDQ